MSRPDNIAEFTLKAVAIGVALGIVFGAANAYLGLRVGMTVSASIPAAVMTVAAFRLLRSPGTTPEANLSQTVASASTSLATGTIFTIPALFLWGAIPPYLQVVVLAFLGGLLGLSAMIPLRRLLIVKAHDELPYPEGTACAEVLRATSSGSAAASGSAWIFRGMAVGAASKGADLARLREAGRARHGGTRAAQSLLRQLKKDYAVGMASFYDSMFKGEDLGSGQREKIYPLVADISRAPRQDIACEALESLQREDLRLSLKNITVPTLLIHVALDRICLPAASEYMAVRLPNSVLAIIAAAGHAPFLTAKESVHKEIKKFIQYI